MEKGNMSSHSWVCGVLIASLVLAAPLSHVAAQQRYHNRLSPAPYAQKEQEDHAAKLLGAAFIVGLLYCAFTNCIGGGSSDGSGAAAPGAYGLGRATEQESTNDTPSSDTSIGCAWGDRAYGTCR